MRATLDGVILVVDVKVAIGVLLELLEKVGVKIGGRMLRGLQAVKTPLTPPLAELHISNAHLQTRMIHQRRQFFFGHIPN